MTDQPKKRGRPPKQPQSDYTVTETEMGQFIVRYKGNVQYTAGTDKQAQNYIEAVQRK